MSRVPDSLRAKARAYIDTCLSPSERASLFGQDNDVEMIERYAACFDREVARGPQAEKPENINDLSPAALGRSFGSLEADE